MRIIILMIVIMKKMILVIMRVMILVLVVMRIMIPVIVSDNEDNDSSDRDGEDK